MDVLIQTCHRLSYYKKYLNYGELGVDFPVPVKTDDGTI